jgi:hypothetical protein
MQTMNDEHVGQCMSRHKMESKEGNVHPEKVIRYVGNNKSGIADK